MPSEPREPSPSAGEAQSSAGEAAAAAGGPRPGRRSFLRGMAGGVAGGVVAGGAAGAAAGYYSRSTPADPAALANEAAVTGRLPAVPFHGKHQAGILPAPTPATAVVSFDVTADDRASLTELFQTVTEHADCRVGAGGPGRDGVDTNPVGAERRRPGPGERFQCRLGGRGDRREGDADRRAH